jgi:hypothetical protein
MKSTSRVDAALVAPKALAKSGIVKTSVSSRTSIKLSGQKVNWLFRPRAGGIQRGQQ